MCSVEMSVFRSGDVSKVDAYEYIEEMSVLSVRVFFVSSNILFCWRLKPFFIKDED
jgi:hypothetical protein